MLCALFPLFILGQEQNTYEKRWEEINNRIEYTKSSRPKGPEKEYITPQSFSEERRNIADYDSRPSNDKIIYSREKRYENGESQGIEKHIKSEESQRIDDLSTPETDAPISAKERSNERRDFGDGTAFKYLFILIGIALVVFLIYYFFFKNPVKADIEIGAFDYENVKEINPETIQKSQLKTDLEKAIGSENYTAGVRIYYILILKTLISRSFIKWERRKTNAHYLIEMTTNKEYKKFNKAINIFEWTWYGKNKPSKQLFERFAAFYDDFLKRLKDE